MCVQIQERLLRLNESIQQASEKANRSLDEIRLVAISKTKPVEAVREAFKVGQLVFGENRVQEAVEKIDVLQDLSGLEWHLVGHLQKNKARFCPGRFQWIHSLDSLELAKRLSRACLEQNTSLNVLIQLNLSGEDSKSGLEDWEQLRHLSEELMNLENLELRARSSRFSRFISSSERCLNCSQSSNPDLLSSPERLSWISTFSEVFCSRHARESLFANSRESRE